MWGQCGPLLQVKVVGFGFTQANSMYTAAAAAAGEGG
jgi:hypothetical protein